MPAQAHAFASQNLLLHRSEVFLFATLRDIADCRDDTGRQEDTGEDKPDPACTAFGCGRMLSYVLIESLISIGYQHALTTILDILIILPNSPKSPDFIGITVDGVELVSESHRLIREDKIKAFRFAIC